MKRTHHRVLWRGAAALAVLAALWGCGERPKPAPMAVAPTGAPKAVALGETTAAGPFQVTLSTREIQIAQGGINFIADVKRDGKPVTDAKVTLTLTQPSAPGTGRSVPLKWNDEHYEGRADVTAKGDWHADVTVDAPGASGTAPFVFSLNQ